MLEKIKTSLRITNTVMDGEILAIIEACKIDLGLSGVKKTDEADPLVERAITLYAKSNFGFSDDSEKYQRAYDMLKCSLSLAGDYNSVE